MPRYLIVLFTVLLIACVGAVTAIPTPANTATPVPSSTPVPTSTALPTSTPAPYEQYTIDFLRTRSYGGGKIEVLQILTETDRFTSYSIRYPSDGLSIYGFVNVPKGSGPFPVIVSIHGYAPDGMYNPFNVTDDFADSFASDAFIVVHPGLRNQPPSDHGDNLLRVGMSVDVLNLLALLKARDDLPPELATADTDSLGLWGMSMGGEIALRVITVNTEIKAVVLYSSLSGDEERNYHQLYEVLRDEQFQLDAQVPLELWDRVSPVYYFSRITAAVQINHGTADTTAPISWAVETCDFLKAAGVAVQCIDYQNADHVFSGNDARMLYQNALEFYRAHLH